MIQLLLGDVVHPGKKAAFSRLVGVNLLPDLYEYLYESIFLYGLIIYLRCYDAEQCRTVLIINEIESFPVFIFQQSKRYLFGVAGQMIFQWWNLMPHLQPPCSVVLRR
jgi:hypothetical protein